MTNSGSLDVGADALDKVPISPEIHPDRTVTFRLYAPKAVEAFVVSGTLGHLFGAQRMEKDASGVWSLTIGPLEPDIYSYGFAVDGGLRSIDPANPNVESLQWGSLSWLHVPGDEPGYCDLQPAAHGDIHIHWYESDVMGGTRRLLVYTPPAYEDTQELYPVLYLLHGAGQQEEAWVSPGRANIILDNLLVANKARPMLIVMPYGHRNRAYDPKDRTPWGESFELFRRELLESIMPYVQTRYRVESDRWHRALAGLSMGGAQTLHIGLSQPELFAWLGSFSTPMDIIDTERLLDSARASRYPQELLWIGCSESDQLYSGNQAFVEKLNHSGIKHLWRTGRGGHSWIFYRPCLHDFLPRLFYSKTGG